MSYLSSSITGIFNDLAKICAYFLTNKREYLSSVLNVIGWGSLLSPVQKSLLSFPYVSNKSNIL